MRDTLKPIAAQTIALARALQAKNAPSAVAGGGWSGSSYVDSWQRTRELAPSQLIDELKGTAWSCISLNAATCATYTPTLYVVTAHNQPKAKCQTKALDAQTDKRLRALPYLKVKTSSAATIEQVTDHPLLDLIYQPNPFFNSFDMWELTQTYLEVMGKAYWYVEPGPYGVPAGIWILPSQNMTPGKRPNSPNAIDFFQYASGKNRQVFGVDEIIFFRNPDPKNPYTGGLSPLRACYEQVMLTSEFAATKSAVYENRGVPSALVSPDEVIGEEERDRLETMWNQKFRRGGSGKVVVTESNMKLQLLSQSLGDIAALADMKATKEDIVNAFHCPISFFTSQTNLANLLASQAQHMSQAITPRIQRRDQKLNQSLVPLYDDSGRLFLSSDDPVPVDQSATIAQLGLDMQYGVLSINEVRSGRGLAPAAWGDVPWLSTRWAPTDVPRGTTGEPETSQADGGSAPSNPGA
jgi:HK97 family phage portal protein